MDRQTKARLDSLLTELQGWTDAPKATARELARRFQLDPLVVERILQAEGWLDAEPGAPDPVDEEVDTEPICVED